MDIKDERIIRELIALEKEEKEMINMLKMFEDLKKMLTVFWLSFFITFSLSYIFPSLKFLGRREEYICPILGYTIGGFWLFFNPLSRKRISSFLGFLVPIFWAVLADLPMAIRQPYPVKQVKYSIFFGLIIFFACKKWLPFKKIWLTLAVTLFPMIIFFLVDDVFFLPFERFIELSLSKIFNEVVLGYLFSETRTLLFLIVSLIVFLWPFLYASSPVVLGMKRKNIIFFLFFSVAIMVTCSVFFAPKSAENGKPMDRYFLTIEDFETMKKNEKNKKK